MSGRNPGEKRFFAGSMCAATRAAVIRGVLPSRAKPAEQGLGVCCPAAGIAAGQAVYWAGWELVGRREVGERYLLGGLRPGQVKVPGFRDF